MASADDRVVCDHSDWPTWFFLELACKYPGCKLYRPPSKPPPLALFPARHLAENLSSAMLSTNSSVTDFDDDDEASDSYDAAVRGARQQSRKALKEFDLQFGKEVFKQRQVRPKTLRARQQRTGKTKSLRIQTKKTLVSVLRQNVVSLLSATASFSSNHASNASCFDDIPNAVRSLSLDLADDAGGSEDMFPGESTPPSYEDVSVVNAQPLASR